MLRTLAIVPPVALALTAASAAPLPRGPPPGRSSSMTAGLPSSGRTGG
jgi:hypothetical protein